jgi:hypothetical protein
LAAVASAKFSPLLSRILVDGAYLRAIAGSFSLLPSIAAAGLAIAALAFNGDQVAPPAWQLFLAIAILGIFDTFAGLVGTAIFVLGSIVTHGYILGLDDIRMLLGIVIVGYGPALLANAFRAFRRVPDEEDSYWWERVVDLAVLPFIAGWSTSAMISTLPALAGVTLAVANHVTDFSLAVAAAVALRVIAEEAVARLAPRRLDRLHPTVVAETIPVQKWTSVALRLGTFIFVTAALMGDDWRVVVGSILFVVPTVIGFYQDRFPNFPWIWRIMPTGIPGLALTLIVATATTALVNSWFGPSADLVYWSFALLPIPMLALSLLGMIGRHGNEGEVRLLRRPMFAWVYRIGGVVMFIVTLKLAGII